MGAGTKSKRPERMMLTRGKKRTLPADDDVKTYPGFDEHAHRLLVVYGTSFAPLAPVLQVVLPSGVVENEKALTPKEGAALIAYPYPQSIADAAVARKFLDTP